MLCAGEMALQLEDSASSWSVKQVAQWLEAEGFPDYVPLLCDQHRLDGPSLLSLRETDLRTPPLQMTVLGDMKRLMLAVNRYSGDLDIFKAGSWLSSTQGGSFP